MIFKDKRLRRFIKKNIFQYVKDCNEIDYSYIKRKVIEHFKNDELTTDEIFNCIYEICVELKIVNADKRWSEDELLKHINSTGIDNIRFLVPMKTSGTPTPFGLLVFGISEERLMKCKIVEKRYKVNDKYKISLTPSDYEWYTNHYYLSDFVMLINTSNIVVLKD